MTTATPARPGIPSPAATPAPLAPRGLSTVRHGLTLAWRNLVKLVASPEALLDVTLQPVIFLVVFVYIFGGAVSGDTSAYLQFALPGVLVQTVIFASAGTGVGLAEDRHTGIFDRFRSLPISRAAPLLGAILADVVRYLGSGVVMLVFGVALGFRFSGSPVAVVAGLGVVMALAFALCWVFTALAMLVREPRSVQGLGFLIMVPLTFGSNVFVPTATLPSWMQGWVEVNPVSAAADALRGLYLGGPVAGSVVQVLVWSAGTVAVFGPVAVALYRRRT